MAALQCYRETSIGMALRAALDELIEAGRISPNVAFRVLAQVLIKKFNLFFIF